MLDTLHPGGGGGNARAGDRDEQRGAGCGRFADGRGTLMGQSGGEYSGYLVVSGSATPTVADSVLVRGSSSTPAGISVLYQDFDSARAFDAGGGAAAVDAAAVSIRSATSRLYIGYGANYHRTAGQAVDIRMGTPEMDLSLPWRCHGHGGDPGKLRTAGLTECNPGL